ncbi:MAG: hypothetical protein ACKOAD_00775 [Gammaproteobacteria bacterium]
MIDLAQVAENIFETSTWVSLLLTIVCLIIGVLLFSGAVTGFKMHKSNPKMVPLDRPIVYLILALTVASMPFWGYFSNDSLNPRDIKRYKQRSSIVDIDEVLD